MKSIMNKKRNKEWERKYVASLTEKSREYSAQLRERIRAMTREELDRFIADRARLNIKLGMDHDRAFQEAIQTAVALGGNASTETTGK